MSEKVIGQVAYDLLAKETFTSIKQKADKTHTHQATDIVESSDKKFVTDADISNWNAKATQEDVTNAIDAIQVVSTIKNGLMSSTMLQQHNKNITDIVDIKEDIENISNGNLTLPIASSTKVGGVKIGANIQISEDGTISGNPQYVHPSTHPATMITQDVTHRFVTDAEKTGWDNKYTREEVDNKISQITSGIEWKPSVETFNDLMSTYPDAKDGWTANVRDTDITYRHKGDGTGAESWIAISANAIPMASTQVDGKMSKEDKAKLDGIQSGANNYIHPLNHPASIITQDTNNRFTTDTEKAKWNSASTDASNALLKSTANEQSISTLSGKVTTLEEKIVIMTTEEAQQIVNKYK